MLKKLVSLCIPALVLVIVFVPIENQVLYWFLYVILFALAGLYFVLNSLVTDKMVEKELGSSDFYSVSAGVIETNGQKAILVQGRFVICQGMALFYVRKRAGGGVTLKDSFPCESVRNYTLKKVDDFHPGIEFEVDGGEKAFTGKKFSSSVDALEKALGWK